jgi:hypothetical protein
MTTGGSLTVANSSNDGTWAGGTLSLIHGGQFAITATTGNSATYSWAGGTWQSDGSIGTNPAGAAGVYVNSSGGGDGTLSMGRSGGATVETLNSLLDIGRLPNSGPASTGAMVFPSNVAAELIMTNNYGQIVVDSAGTLTINTGPSANFEGIYTYNTGFSGTLCKITNNLGAIKFQTANSSWDIEEDAPIINNGGGILYSHGSNGPVKVVANVDSTVGDYLDINGGTVAVNDGVAINCYEHSSGNPFFINGGTLSIYDATGSGDDVSMTGEGLQMVHGTLSIGTSLSKPYEIFGLNVDGSVSITGGTFSTYAYAYSFIGSAYLNYGGIETIGSSQTLTLGSGATLKVLMQGDNSSSSGGVTAPLIGSYASSAGSDFGTKIYAPDSNLLYSYSESFGSTRSTITVTYHGSAPERRPPAHVTPVAAAARPPSFPMATRPKHGVGTMYTDLSDWLTGICGMEVTLLKSLS